MNRIQRADRFDVRHSNHGGIEVSRTFFVEFVFPKRAPVDRSLVVVMSCPPV